MKIIQLLTIISSSVLLIACSTMEGMGKDIQSLGKTIEKTAGHSGATDNKPVQQPSGAVVTPVQ
jgi:predicted small secreted protein